MPERSCEQCDRPVWARGMCSTHYAAEWRTKNDRIERTCARCGEKFMARGDSVRAGNGRYCSHACRNRANNAARGFNPRAPRKSAVRKRAEKRAARAAVGTLSGKRVWIQGPCGHCGTEFLPTPGGSYCSPECKEAARHARKLARGSVGTWIKRRDRLALYDRDGYNCHICGESTSREYESSDPWSPTLDHLVPRALGGGDEPDNLATAHLWCNSVRGDLTYFTDGDLAAEV